MDSGFPYGFPFAPYAIQGDFMASLHECLDKRAVGLFESPTGTGKSLSLICGLLSWLERNRYGTAPQPAPGTKLDALAAHALKMQVQKHDARVSEQKQQRDRLHKAMAGAGDASWADGIKAGKRGRGTAADAKRAKPGADDLDAWLLPDEAPRAAGRAYDGSSDSDHDGDEPSPLERPATTTKIFYTSRTHSQLKQFVGELQRTGYATTTLVASMGARTTLCVHEPVKGTQQQQRSASAVNDACQDLREKRGGCPCNRKEAVQQLALRSLRTVLHVEELAHHGLMSGACAYYASRDMMAQADVVVLPYQMLLHARTREALGVALQDAIVVIDEAHNVVDAINDVHSARLSADQIAAARAMLDAYMERYEARLSEPNKADMKKLQSFVGALAVKLPALAKADTDQQQLFTVTSLMFALNEDMFNHFEMAAFVRDRRLANVMRGFHGAYVAAAGAATGNAAAAPAETKGAFHALTAFIECLANPDGDGRVLVQFRPRVRVEYLLLSPGRCFAELARECRSVVLAGGTLAPFAVLVKQLMPDPGRELVTFSCGHVVPAHNLLVLSVSKAPTDRSLDFSFHNRGTHAMEDLCTSLANLRRVTPAGMVVFFPSYAVEAQFYEHCVAHGALARMGQLFRGDGDLFKPYADAIRAGTRATLWAVVGGTLSEGINFSDDLGRCVVMVGVPYPNTRDVVLQARLARLGDGHYEALTARAVNQSIGRAIRHMGDYACVVLLDARYEELAPKWLPAWMKRSLQHASAFGAVPSQLAAFFRGKPVAVPV